RAKEEEGRTLIQRSPMRAHLVFAACASVCVAACATTSNPPPQSSPPADRNPQLSEPVSPRTASPAEYQQLFDSVGDRCYAGDRFPTSALLQLVRFNYTRTSVQRRSRQISDADNLSMLGDIEVAKFKGSDLIVVGPPASEAGGLRPEDWYAAFHALTDDGGPGVTIDPGPNPELMSVRFFGGIENTALGNTFFEADRALKLMATGFDNTNCSRWSELPRGVRTELDLMGDEVAAGEGIPGAGQWHRFWSEPNEQPLETEGNSLSIPLERLIAKDESIPAGRPSPKSATQFAHAITSEFSHLQSDIPAFAELQRDAALVMLAKWVRDKQLPVEEDWLTGDAPRRPTPSTTPGVTVMRARVTDRFYLRYGIHGGVDFQRSNR